MKALYTAKATSTGGRAGHVETDDKRLVFDLTPFDSKVGTNPEQLFACGYAACFGSAVDHVAKSQKIDAGEITVKSEVTISQGDQGFFLSAVLNVSFPSLDQKTAEALVAKAHQVCPYSKATRGNIEVQLRVNGTELADAA